MIYDTLDEMWVRALTELLASGQHQPSRNGKTIEKLAYQATLRSSKYAWLHNSRRALDPRYACAELLWYMSREHRIDMLLAYAPQYEKFAEDGVAHGAYGYRWAHNITTTTADQIDLVIELLQQSGSSRQAIVTMWTANDLVHAIRHDKKDLPCTLTWQFLIRGDGLHMITTMRSQDIWLGLPYDVFVNTQIQQLIAATLGLRAACYTHQCGSLHVYEKHWAAAVAATSPRIVNDSVTRSLHNPVDWVASPLCMRHADVAIMSERAFRVSKALRIEFPDTGSFCLLEAARVCGTKFHPSLADGIHCAAMREGLKTYANHRRA